MFNMEMVGRKIAELRKSHNMTQLELADRIGISFQAVSNWERGNSMPDISKLPELAALFEVTIDELLGEHSEILESAAKGNIKEYVQNNEVTSEEIQNIAPILKPEQINDVVQSLVSLSDLGNLTDLTGNRKNVRKRNERLRELEDILPFVGRDMVDKIALDAAENGEYSALDTVVPFASQNVINDIARKMIQEGKNIGDIAPWVSRDIIGALATRLYEKGGLGALDDIAPFIPKEQLRQIAEEEYENRGLQHLESIAPFLNRKYLNELAQKAIQKNGIKAISNIAPFLDKGMLAEYVKERYL